MTLSLIALVLTAAVIDSLQHFLIKSGGDPFTRSLSVAMMGGVLAAPTLLITGMPNPAAWPLLAVSIVLGSLYWFVLGWAYRGEALAVVAPISRGAGIMLTALGGRFVFEDRLTTSQIWMLTLILAGLALIAFNKRALGQRIALPSICLSVVIASFTLLDAVGVRLSGSALAYCCVLYLGNSLVIGALTLPRIGLRAACVDLPSVSIAALMSLTVYVMILYALTHGPVAVVAALTETSIVFSALLGIFWLHERTSPRHSLGLGLIAMGVILLRLDVWANPAVG